MNINACLTCDNCIIAEQKLITLTRGGGTAHLFFTCVNNCLKDAYGNPNSIVARDYIVDLKTMQAWRDGGDHVPDEGCPNYIFNTKLDPELKKEGCLKYIDSVNLEPVIKRAIKMKTISLGKNFPNIQLDDTVDIGELSDGYHTFNELYEHRILLFLALMKTSANDSLVKDYGWSKRHSDGELCFGGGWCIGWIVLENGLEIRYHFNESYVTPEILHLEHLFGREYSGKEETIDGLKYLIAGQSQVLDNILKKIDSIYLTKPIYFSKSGYEKKSICGTIIISGLLLEENVEELKYIVVKPFNDDNLLVNYFILEIDGLLVSIDNIHFTPFRNII